MAEELFNADEMKEIIEGFLVESEELVSKLDGDLVELEKRTEDLELLNQIFRSAHTIKGTSGFLGLDKITTLTHHMEDVLNRLRKGEIKINQDIMDVILQAVDCLKILLEDVRQGRDSQLDLSDIVGKLEQLYQGTASKTTEIKPEVQEIPRVQEETAVVSGPNSDAVPEKTKIPVDIKKKEQTIRVDVGRLDTLMDMVGELVLARNSTMQVLSDFNAKLKDDGRVNLERFNQSSMQINFIATELQMAVMKMRMQPVEKVFNRFPRMVRDLSRERGKEVELLIYGEETELDKSVLEEIGDPLVHLIRNSVDHGIEPSEERVKLGKSPKGKLILKAGQEGNHIVIEVQDDGRGMDVEAIKSKALERNLVSAEKLKGMSEQDILNFIFEPGFSTAKQVTNVSGRGVGMDVVRTNITKLKGMIDLSTTFGQGSKVTIKLPLTLAIVQGLLVSSGEEVFVVPLASVLETLHLGDHNLFSINQRSVINLRGSILPLVDIREVLDKNWGSGQPTESGSYVVVIGLGEKKLGLLVDRLLGQEEVVIKSLGDFLGNVEGISGATIMGDGRVRMIIDIAGLFRLTEKALR